MSATEATTSRTWIRRIGIAVAGATLLSAGTATANAWGTTVPCGSPATRAVFAAWGDKAQYFRIHDGGFETAPSQWKLARTGASIVADNEPLKVAGAKDQRALRLSPGATAESRTFCLRNLDERFRFFVKHTGGADARLAVNLEVWDAKASAPWTVVIQPAMLTPVGGGWSISPVVWLKLPDILNWRFGELASRPNLNVTITFEAVAGTWTIDDVHLDPFRSR